MDTICSLFWKDVTGLKMINTMDYNNMTIEQAAKYAFDSSKLNCAFIRNRELVDFSGRFRNFYVNGTQYVLKIFDNFKDANTEFSNVLKVKALTELTIDILIPLPLITKLSEDNWGLVMRDYGFTLDENVETTKTILPLENVYKFLFDLLNCGIVWKGFLPRNIIFHENKLILIDWEKVSFCEAECQRVIDDQTIFFWNLGWSQIYPEINFYHQLKKYPLFQLSKSVKLDSFEKILKTFIGHSHHDEQITREIGNNITQISEGPMNYISLNYFNPHDFGHLIDDLFPKAISVFYSLASSKLREEVGDTGFSTLITAYSKYLVLYVSDYYKTNDTIYMKSESHPENLLVLFEIITKIFNKELLDFEILTSLVKWREWMKSNKSYYYYYHKILSVVEKKGLLNSSRRSHYISKFVEKIFGLIYNVFPEKPEVFLMFRGSLGNHVLTCKSDVDFEISGPNYPNGHKGLEEVLSNILVFFQLECENSDGRPEEIDMVSDQGYTRDLHEWTELRGSNHLQDPTWLRKRMNLDYSVFKKLSIYESSLLDLNEKVLFFLVRSTISRLAFLYGGNHSCTLCQLKHIRSVNYNLSKELFEMLIESITYYENDCRDRSMILSLCGRIAVVRKKEGIQIPKAISS